MGLDIASHRMKGSHYNDIRYSRRHNSNITKANRRSLFALPFTWPSSNLPLVLRLKGVLPESRSTSLKKSCHGPDLNQVWIGMEKPCLRCLSKPTGNKRLASFFRSILLLEDVAFKYEGTLPKANSITR